MKHNNITLTQVGEYPNSRNCRLDKISYMSCPRCKKPLRRLSDGFRFCPYCDWIELPLQESLSEESRAGKAGFKISMRGKARAENKKAESGHFSLSIRQEKFKNI